MVERSSPNDLLLVVGMELDHGADVTPATTVLIGVLAAAIGGYLVLGTRPAAVAVLKALYRWPLFVPFIVAAQCTR
jgi:hypothetical protein